jgi:hypothetical protein
VFVVVAFVLGVAVPVVHVVDVVAVGYGVVPAALAVLVGVVRVRGMLQGSLVVVAVVRAMRVAVVDVVGVIAVVDGDVAAALAVLVGVVFVDVVIAHGCIASLLPDSS